jgi:hypothetical protein
VVKEGVVIFYLFRFFFRGVIVELGASSIYFWQQKRFDKGKLTIDPDTITGGIKQQLKIIHSGKI